MKGLYKNFLFKLLITPFTYIVSGIFVVLSVLQFFILQKFFSDVGSSDMHRFFTGIPYLCILAVPTIGSFISMSKENLSMPCSSIELVTAKTATLSTVLISALALTAVVPITVSFFGDVEMSVIVCGYIGLIFYLVTTCSFSVLIYTSIDNTGFAFIIQALSLALVNNIHALAAYIPSNDFISSTAKHISFAWHFDAAGKGIIDSRDVFFYVSSTAIFITLATLIMERKRGDRSKFIRMVAILSAAAFVLLSIDTSKFYLRIDTTAAKSFSVSKYSRALINEIEEPMTITYYRSSSLKNLYPQVRDIDDFLKSYSDISSNISYSIVDPIKNNLTEKLKSYGIQGQKIQSTGKESTSYVTVYSAVVINYLGDTITIPFVLSTATLEYNLAEKLDSLLRGKDRLIQVVVGNGLSFDEDYAPVKPWLETLGFTVVQTYLPSEIAEGKKNIFTLYPDVPLIVFGTALFTQEDAQALVNFVRGNGKVFLAAAPYTIDIKKDWSVIGVEDYVLYALQEFGIYYRDTITCDSENFKVGLYSADSKQNASSVQSEYVSYPMWPELKPQENAVNGLTTFWPCAIDFDNEVAQDSGMTVKSYLSTSKESWQNKKINGKFITNPFSETIKPDGGEDFCQYNLAVCLTKDESYQPSLIATGDQYAFTSEMIGYSSSEANINTKSLDFLSNCALSISGEKSLLELKMASYTNNSLYKIPLNKIYNLRIFITIISCLVPSAILMGIYLVVACKRRKINRRLQDEKK